MTKNQRRVKAAKITDEEFDEFAVSESFVGHGIRLKFCYTCRSELFVWKDIDSYDPVDGTPDVWYTYICPKVLKEGREYLDLTETKRFFTSKPCHQIGCEDYGG